MSKVITDSRILVCGPLPKRLVTGVRLALGLLVEGLKTSGLNCTVVDTTFRDNIPTPGSFSFGRAIETIVVIVLVWWKLLWCDIYYATISTSSMGFWRDFLTVKVAALLKRRVILHLHGGGFESFFQAQGPWMQRRIVRTLNSASAIVVLGERLKDQFSCAGSEVFDKLVVVPNGLTMGIDEPVAENKRLPCRGEPVNLLYLSSLMQSKGFLDVLKAVKRLNEMGSAQRFHLHLCGSFVSISKETGCDIYDEKSLENYLDLEALTGCVTYYQQVLGIEKEQRFKQAHIFLLPTYYPWEGQPLSIIEALAYSTPVISTPHKGIPEEVIDGVNGRLVPPKSPAEIADAILEIVADEGRYDAMSYTARQHYEKNFRRSVHLKRLISTILGCKECDLSDIGL